MEISFNISYKTWVQFPQIEGQRRNRFGDIRIVPMRVVFKKVKAFDCNLFFLGNLPEVKTVEIEVSFDLIVFGFIIEQVLTLIWYLKFVFFRCLILFKSTIFTL